MPENEPEPVTQDEHKEIASINNPWSLAAWYVKQYGGLAFGVSSLLITWMFIVRPILDQKIYDEKVIESLILETTEQRNTMRRNVEQQKITAAILERIVEKLDQ